MKLEITGDQISGEHDGLTFTVTDKDQVDVLRQAAMSAILNSLPDARAIAEKRKWAETSQDQKTLVRRGAGYDLRLTHQGIDACDAESLARYAGNGQAEFARKQPY